MSIPWVEFGREAFETAVHGQKPVLLILAPRWTRGRVEAVFTGPVVPLARDAFVPVYEDPDRRPDLAARYGAGDAPSASVLTYAGDVLAVTSVGSAGAFADWLRAQVARFGREREALSAGLAAERAEARSREAAVELRERLDPEAPRRVLEAVLAEYDAAHGGFGDGGKTLQPDTLELLLYAAAEWDHAGAREALIGTLRAAAGGGLRDAVEGGFFRRCAKRDWSEAEFEKRLSDNARFASVYLDAYRLTGDEALRRAAEETLGWMKLSLWDAETGAFGASEHAPEAAEGTVRSERLSAGSRPEIDRTVLVDANAMAVPALLKAATVFVDRREEFERMATRVLSLLETRFFDHHDGMAHWAEPGGPPRETGLLSDQAWTMLAFTEAFQYFMSRGHRDFADELLRLTLRALWYREKAGFHDRPVDESQPGLLSVPRLPYDLNAAAFEALWRLSEMKGIPNYARWLEMGFMNLWPRVEGRPHEAAPYARLYDVFLKGRVELDLIGRAEDPKTREILSALRGRYLPRALVSFIDPDDMDFILAHRLTAARYPRLFVIKNGRPAASGETAEEVAQAVTSLRAP